MNPRIVLIIFLIIVSIVLYIFTDWPLLWKLSPIWIVIVPLMIRGLVHKDDKNSWQCTCGSTHFEYKEGATVEVSWAVYEIPQIRKCKSCSTELVTAGTRIDLTRFDG